MELIVLGAAPAYTDREGSAAAGHLLIQGGAALLLDLGQGAFPNLARAWQPERLTAIAISHLHPDHFVDLVPLRHYLRYECDPPRRVRVLGPRELAGRLDALHAEPGFSAASFDLEALDERVRRLGPFLLETRRVSHTDESYAFRVSVAEAGPNAAGLVYSGDCGRAGDLAPLIRPSDVLLAEVSFGPGPVPQGVLHLDGPAVGAVAAASHAGRALLTHLLMRRDPDATIAAVRQAFDGPVAFVCEGDRIAI